MAAFATKNAINRERFSSITGWLLWLSIEDNSSVFLIEAFVLPQEYSMDTRSARGYAQFCHFRM
jgi:hypothetical protein